MYLGAQLFGVLANTSLAPAEAFEKLRDIGYTHVEPCLALEPLGAWEQVIWPLAEFDGYMDTIRSLKEDYSDRIEIKTGLEAGICFIDQYGCSLMGHIGLHKGSL